MEYFLLEQSKAVVNAIKLVMMEPQKYTAEMTHKDFKELESTSVAYAEYERTQEMPDVLKHPTYMISDELRKVLQMYDESISFKAVQVFPHRPEYIREASKVYWVYDCISEECMHTETVILPNGAVQELILDKRKIRGRDIFRVRGLMENKIIVSLAVAESLLRRNPYGIRLERVKVK